MYYLSILGKDMGPFTLEELQELVKQGRLSEDTVVKVDGKTIKAGEIEGMEGGVVKEEGTQVTNITTQKYWFLGWALFSSLLSILLIFPAPIYLLTNIIIFIFLCVVPPVIISVRRLLVFQGIIALFYIILAGLRLVSCTIFLSQHAMSLESAFLQACDYTSTSLIRAAIAGLLLSGIWVWLRILPRRF